MSRRLITDRDVFAGLLAKGLRAFTANGILGDARPADRERGRRYLEAMTDYLATNLARVEPESTSA